MRERPRAAVTAVAIAVALLGTAPVAWASFDDVSAASASYTADVLAPATNLSAAAGFCSTLSGDRTVLSWTATASTWATGYEIARSTTAGGPYTVVGTASGAGTTTYTDAGLAYSTTFYYAIRSMRNAWRGTNATTSRTTKNSLCF